MSSLLLFILCLLGSCAVVVAVIVIEFTYFSKSNDGLQSGTRQLIFFSLFFGFSGLIPGCFSRNFGYVLAILSGLAPIELLAFFVYEVGSQGTHSLSPTAQAAEEKEQARVKARRAGLTRAYLAQLEAIARTHPYTGRDSTQPCYTAEQMPSLTGKLEFHPEQRESYRELAQLLSRHATPNLNPT